MGGSRQRSCSFWEMGGVMFANNKYLQNTLCTHLNNQYFRNGAKSQSAGLVAGCSPIAPGKFYYRKKIKTVWKKNLTQAGIASPEKITVVAWSILTKDHIHFGINGLQRTHLSLHGKNMNS